MQRFLVVLIAVALTVGTTGSGFATDVKKPGTQSSATVQPGVAVRPKLQPQPVRPAARAATRPSQTKPAVVAGQLKTLPPAADAFFKQKAAADRQRQQQAAALKKVTPQPVNPKPVTPQPRNTQLNSTAASNPRSDWYFSPYYGWVNRRYWNSYGYNPYYDYAPYYGSSYDYGPYGYGYGYNNSLYWPYYQAWRFPPPIFMPAGELFGPGPILRMMGVAPWFAPPAANVQPNVAAAAPVAVPAPPVPRVARRDADDDLPAGGKAAERGTNQRANNLAWRYISFGDAHFANQKYSEAYDRYKKAAQSGPQVADAWFRQGFALAALGRYEQAVKAIKRGLELRPDWAASDFTLDEIFGKDDVAKKSRLDAMTKAAEDDPNNGDLEYLLGLHLYFDGKPDKAAGFFHRSAELGGNDGALKGFFKEKG
jgi:tetratricopeptide (TPR) repeat protein